MATVPVKSHQPLHNFSLPFLRWGHRSHTNINHRFDSTHNSPPVHRRLPKSDSDSDYENRHKPTVRQRNRSLSFASCSTTTTTLHKVKDDAVYVERESNGGDEEEEREETESVVKPWNLRPRKGSVIPGVHTVPVPVPTVAAVTKSLRLRGLATEGEGEKRKLWISLSREEIEEDVYSLTGSKPARRPKKRPKTVQKQLDNLFPGVYLVGITADSYRVHNDLK